MPCQWWLFDAPPTIHHTVSPQSWHWHHHGTTHTSLQLSCGRVQCDDLRRLSLMGDESTHAQTIGLARG